MIDITSYSILVVGDSEFPGCKFDGYDHHSVYGI